MVERANDTAAWPRGCRGASVVETVLVLALTGLLAGTAWPSMARYLESAELRAATLRFAAALARGRIAALTEGRTWRVRLDGTQGYISSPDGAVAPPAEQLPATTFFAGATSGGDV